MSIYKQVLEAYSDALRRELALLGIKVIIKVLSDKNSCKILQSQDSCL